MTGRGHRRHPRTMSTSSRALSRRAPVRTVFDDADARHVTAPDPRLATARRWAAGGLALATLGLVVLVGWFVAAVTATAPGVALGARGLLGVAAVVLPATLVGWCTGFATVSVIVRHDAAGPRLVGLVAALVGTCLGGALLAVQAGL